tara:strand:+ start:585 stop:1427 length:843 start_codon:yes stop_codon:yes gene_type:complete
MRNRILKRPMFRMGGDVENTGIMNGMRQRYADSSSEGVQPKREPMLFRPSMNDFLIQFGLDLASRPPGGNIFQTAAAAAKEPFQVMQAKKLREQELLGDREFQKELLQEKLAGQKEIAQIGQGMKNYDTYLDAGLKRFDNDVIMAENFANFMSTIKPELDTTYGKSQFGGFIQTDLDKKDAKQKFLNKNSGKIGKVFYDLKQDKLYQIVQRDETIGLQEVTIANISDTEGDVQPVPTEKKTVTDKRNEYRDTINPQLKKIREKKTKELEEKFGVEDDVDI